MMMSRYAVVILAVALCFCSCRSGEKQSEGAATAEADVDSVAELPLPEVPPALTAPVERADYVMAHFWDAMDFSDSLRSHNRKFMEPNLVNFMSLLPHGSEQGRSQGVSALLGKAISDSVAFSLVTDIMERYLDDPNSPMRDENHYIVYLQELLRLSGLPEHDQTRNAYKLENAQKNRPGTTATDFAYIDRDGRRSTLHHTAAGRQLLLLFYDPECGHCTEILRQVNESAVISNSINQKTLTVLAVYTEGKRQLWNETKASMPQQWTVGYDIDSIVDHELYTLPAMPVMYLLDRNKRVLLKDAFLPEIEDRLKVSP